MDGGYTVGGGVQAGLSSLAVLVFQWVPSVILSLSGTGSSMLNAPLSAPIHSAVTVSNVTDYIQNVSTPTAYNQFIINWGIFAAISIFVSLILMCILVYCVVRLLQVRKFEAARFRGLSETPITRDVPKTHVRWERIVNQINSDDEQSWRLSILEADIMLNELLDMLGYRGETLADKMRGVERTQFNSIDSAWEAHRERNKIAHESTDIKLEARDARHTISLYQRVFREFKVIE